MIANISLLANQNLPSDGSEGWDSGVIITVVFGCVASVLALLTLCATFWLGRKDSNAATHGMLF